jgi:hypothetical protein
LITVIYKIVCNDLSITECYVGHTTDFVRRKWSHKRNTVFENGRDYNFKVYVTIRNNGGWDNWTMIEIEEYPCKDVNDAKKKEREWFGNLNSKLNTLYPQRTDQEYYIDNRERIVANVRKYADNNKVKINKRERLHRISHKEENSIRRSKRIICECGIEINLDHKSRHLKTKVHNDNLNTLI